MRIVIAAVLASLLLALSGCGHVAGNYPPVKVKVPKELPREYKARDTVLPMVWSDPGRVHGFGNTVRMASEVAGQLEMAAKMGNAAAARDAKILARMAEDNLAFAVMILFVDKTVEFRVDEGDLQVAFSDGSTANDAGVLLYKPGTMQDDPNLSLNSALKIRGKDDPKVQGRWAFVFFPAEHAQKTVASIKPAA
jgi:hypothetical protein